MNKRRKIFAVALAVLITMLAFTACGVSEETDGINSLADLEGKKIGIMTGSSFDAMADKYFNSIEKVYLDSFVNLAMALEENKVDAYLMEEPVMRLIMLEYPNQIILDRLESYGYAFVMPKDHTALCQELNEYLAQIKEDGTLEEIDSIWFGSDESKQIVDMSGLTGENGTLHFVGTTESGAPFFFVKDGTLAGYDLDIAVRFCREKGYKIEVEDVRFTSMLAGISTGKYDFGASCITITEERKASVLFSDPDYLGSAVVVVKGQPGDSSNEKEYTAESLKGKKAAVITGSVFDQVLENNHIDVQIDYYNLISDIPAAVDAGKADFYVSDEPVARSMCKEYTNQEIKMQLAPDEYGFAFPKGSEKGELLQKQMNEFLKKIREDGTLKEIDGIWFGDDEDAKVVDMSDLTGENGTLNFACCSGQAPFICIKDGAFAGYEMDIAARFCREYGYALNISDSNFAGVIAAVSAGKADMCAASISITEERKQSMLFSDPDYQGGVVIVAAKDQTAVSEEKGFFNSILDSFNKTFIREGRWKLFASGLGVTVLVTVLSALFGTALGFLIFVLYRSQGKVFRGTVDFFINIFEKTPTVVILMILYYIIFGKSQIEGMWISVIGFSVLFAGGVVSLFKMGDAAVDKGQLEAALSMSYTEGQAFTHVILPQIVRIVLPGYRGSIVSLIKDTAILGYIAVQDLTKASDIIRSRTYEAFFPLIVTAVIYFFCAWLLSQLVKLLERKVDPGHRNTDNVLKGVKTK